MVILAIAKAKENSVSNFSSFLKNLPYSGLLLVFGVIILSGINSEDNNAWMHQVKLKLPFLILPIAFYFLKPMEKKPHQWIHLGLIGVILVSSFQVIGNFFLDYESISSGINRGKSIPTPIDHIHYSIILAYATVSCFVLGILETTKKWKIILFIGGLYLFGYCHFLSVRTGLALCYAGIGVTLIWYVTSTKKYLIGLSVTALIVILPFVAYHTIKPFHNKVQYMMWDIKQYQKGNGKNYSDSERLMSYQIAIDLIKDAPILGHGIGDLRPLTTQKHKEKYGVKDKYIYPHNQYLFMLTAVGIFGALVFFFGLFCPLLFVKERNIFLVLIFMMLMLSFLVENTIQRAVITAFFLFFILLNLGVKLEDRLDKID
ncbi:MAG: O-antigen ligase [Halioglobus sp.]|jgi:O-antigen ligase